MAASLTDETAPKPPQAVPEALARLETAIAKATQVPNHPMLATLEACHAHLSAFARISTDVNLGMQLLLRQMRKPLTPDEVKGISQETASASLAAISRLNRAFGFRTMLLAVAALVGTGAGCGYAGYAAGHQSGLQETSAFRELGSADAKEWLRLMRVNADVVSTLSLCGKPEVPLVVTKNGRHACAVPLYLD